MPKIATIEEYAAAVKKIQNGNKQLYRGQSNSGWEIQSTLERFGIKRLACEEYYWKVESYKPLINSIVERKFERKVDSSGYKFDFNNYYDASWVLPDMEYLTYLRHHGFPTPLVDWSRSLYVALFFACEDHFDKDGKVFIYIPSNMQSGGTNVPELRHIGRYIETDQRHFAQQSEYLVPMEYTDKWEFITYNEIKQGEFSHTIVGVEIDKNAKVEIMNSLNKMNINRYTIYLDEDSLIKSLKDEWKQEQEL